MKLKELSEQERPREKLLAKGGKALDNSELLAILIRTGTGTRNAIETAQDLLHRAGNRLNQLGSFSIEQIREVPGIGPDKAATIAAAMELGKRFIAEQDDRSKISITGAKQIYRMMLPITKGLQHEECWVIFLNRANRVISKEMLSSGGMDATILDIKMILRKALEKKAHGIILVHNHPSGNPKPGIQDIRQTRMLKRAADTFEISLLDHVVMADDRYYSFAEEGIGT